MPFNFLKHFYQHVHNSLVWLIVYFAFQTIILVALALLIWIYPQALFILISLLFLLLAVISIFLACIISKYVFKLKKVKNLLTGHWH